MLMMKRMRATVVILFLASLVSGVADSTNAPPANETQMSQPAPTFTLKNLAGDEICSTNDSCRRSSKTRDETSRHHSGLVRFGGDAGGQSNCRPSAALGGQARAGHRVSRGGRRRPRRTVAHPRQSGRAAGTDPNGVETGI